MNYAPVSLLASALLIAAAPAAATTSVQFAKASFDATTSIGSSVQLNYNAVASAGGSARQFTNIGGQVNFELISVTHSTVGANVNSAWRFLATITNTSAAPMTSARISAVGFSTAAGNALAENPPFLALSGVSTAGTPGLFNSIAFSNSGLNLPNVSGSPNPQICLKAGGPTNNCAGGGGNGLTMANPFPATSTEFVLNFTAPTARTSITLHNFVLRFQSLTGTGQTSGGNFNLNDGSGVGIVTGVQYGPGIDPVPEPASWLMLISGFGLIGTAMRRRRLQAA